MKLQLTIELVENQFHPKHKLTLQAIAMIDGCNERTVWKHQNAKNYNKIQIIRLELSTVLINIEMIKYEVVVCYKKKTKLINLLNKIKQ